MGMGIEFTQECTLLRLVSAVPEVNFVAGQIFGERGVMYIKGQNKRGGFRSNIPKVDIDVVQKQFLCSSWTQHQQCDEIMHVGLVHDTWYHSPITRPVQR